MIPFSGRRTKTETVLTARTGNDYEYYTYGCHHGYNYGYGYDIEYKQTNHTGS